VLRGLNHEFSNLLTALGGVSLGSDGEDGDDGADGGPSRLDQEIERLDGLLRLYRLLPFAARAGGEPVLVADIIPDAVQLLKHHLELRDVPCEVEGVADLLPVVVHPTALTQAVLLCLCAAARSLPAADASAGIRVRCGGDTEWAHVVAETTVPTDGAVSDSEPAEFVALRWLLRGAEGTATLTRGGEGVVRASIRVATLIRTRAVERRA
jgi:signal transduction histidine kinase